MYHLCVQSIKKKITHHVSKEENDYQVHHEEDNDMSGGAVTVVARPGTGKPGSTNSTRSKQARISTTACKSEHALYLIDGNLA